MKPLQRFCLTLDLKSDPDLIRDYLYWHEPEHIWPEIPAGIRAAGITNMEIYRFDTRLFMILEADEKFDFKTNMEYLATLQGQKEWETFVAKYQVTQPGSQAAEKWKLMEKIFSL